MKIHATAIILLATFSTVANSQDISQSEEWMCKPVEAHATLISESAEIKSKSAQLLEPGVFYLRRSAGSATEWTQISRGSIESKLECSVGEAIFGRLECGRALTGLLIDLPSGYGVSVVRAVLEKELLVTMTSIKCQRN